MHTVTLRPILLVCLSLFFGGPALRASSEMTLDLGGAGWTFAIDPTDRGTSTQWHQPAADWDGTKPHASFGWDAVVVPHDFLSDPQYAYTGVGWYRRSIAIPVGAKEGRVWRLLFDVVFQRCRVWLNGQLVGAHEGGYAPFEFDVTEHLVAGRENFLVVAVDNRIKFRALPGARSGNTANAGQYPWLNYGGILGAVKLVGHDPLWCAAQKIETTLGADRWNITVRVDLRNDTKALRQGTVSAAISAGNVRLSGSYRVPARGKSTVVLTGSVPKSDVKAWDLDSLQLYTSEVSLGSDAPRLVSTFGFRTLEIRDAQFLLNGRAVRLAGANRARGHPVHGGIDRDDVVAQDFTMMKEAGLVFARIQHTAPSRNVLDWADRHGFLLVLEVGMWGYVSADQASPELRGQFQAEMREMIALAQNHPSVVGWSLGNEYESWTPEGVAWTRDMAAFVKGIDATRPVTFAAIGTALRKLRAGEGAGEHAFDHVDYISANFYFKPAEMADYLDPVHARWPGKPVAITEFGLRQDRTKDERQRLDHFDAMLAEVRPRPWICGLSFWSFNDYASRYPGTGKDGYRRWGLVDPYRNPRELYDHVKPLLKDGLAGPAADRPNR